ncbi:2-dehydropantoate 2-reductase [Robertkochia marina]|uniref:2-dehydropantoate 2-reductase n=1 Tax=Robertkochia marina TaxID=1227945 RepID=A0A4S3M3I1_9FLAO|nr:2-dehydropantoate 2-reductase [Robertkochia marina]THD69666.1 2-dehydropantoate 2-reductase [Robertkochia marina]TRZ46989.1 2-dehydropantoate 2-reductase [Robertkochia marina]
MRIIVVGIGGVGGYFGGRLALTDHQVEFVVRGPHGDAIRKNGLLVKSIYGDFTAHPDSVHPDLGSVVDPDLVLVCTKSWQLEEVARGLKDKVLPTTRILPLQNGVNSIEKLTGFLPENLILGGLCKIISKIDAPGVINHFAFHPQIIFGEVNGNESESAREVRKVLEGAGIDVVLSDDIRLDVWRKFLFICTISGLGGVCRQEIGVMREDPGLRELMMQTAREILALAGKKEIGLTVNDIEKTFQAIDKQAYHSTASVQRDLMEGRPSEIHDFNGYVVSESEKYGLEAPVNKFIYYSLRPMEDHARKN